MPNLTLSDAAYSRALGVVPGGMSRFLPMANPRPVYISHGEGAWIFDIDGNRYLDFNNNFTALIHGHAHPATVDAVVAQARRGTSFGSPTESEALLAADIIARYPGTARVRFQNSGTESVMVAIKAARALTGRPAIAKLEGAYHGFYDYAEVGQEISGDLADPVGVALSPGAPDSIARDVLMLRMNDIAHADRMLQKERHRLAAILIDAMPGRAGMVRLTAGYAAFLRDFATRHGIVLISDEVMSFRMGPNGALATAGVQADLYALGKVVGGGMALGAVAGHEAAMRAFDATPSRRGVPSSGTHSANPMSLAAGLATLSEWRTPAMERLRIMGDDLRARASGVLGKHGYWPCVNGAASLFRLVTKLQPISGYAQSGLQPEEQAAQTAMIAGLLDRGVWVTAHGLGCLSTAMRSEDIDHMIAALDSSLADVPQRCRPGP